MREIKLPSLSPRANATADVEDACEGCGSCVGRRDFVLRGFGALVAAAVMGTLPRSVAAQPIRWIQGTGSGAARRYPVPTDDGVHVDRAQEIIVVRYRGLLAAFALSCPHQRSMLRWKPDDGIFQCTKHHSEYKPTGEYIKGRATRNMDRLAVHIDGGELVVDVATVYKSDEDPSGWATAAIPVS
jgi:nitrite reductase/ring-hydroxylating ferredoxin subunit